MDNKILEYKKILNLNIYAIARKTDDFSGTLIRKHPGSLHQQSYRRQTHGIRN